MSNMENSYDNLPEVDEDPEAHMRSLEETWRWAAFGDCDSELAGRYEEAIVQLANKYPDLPTTPEMIQTRKPKEEPQEESKLIRRKTQPQHEYSRIPLRTAVAGEQVRRESFKRPKWQSLVGFIGSKLVGEKPRNNA